MKQHSPKPFVKWAGGKSQLIPQIERSLPPGLDGRKDLTYIEPFVGGGAVLFWLLNHYPNIERAIINDINPRLIATYRAVKETPERLIERLLRLQSEYLPLDEVERKAYYLRQRERFNTVPMDDTDIAALFIFLNRTGFNGLYRVNSKGHYNVPHGRYSMPRICDEETIMADSAILSRTTILCGDFTQTAPYVSENTLFYFDPPYKPLTQTASFTAYSKEDFTDDDQLRLRNFCDYISEYKSRFILSNSDPKNADPADSFFDDLYARFNIRRVAANRMINSVAEKRGKLHELMISNTPQHQLP